MDAPTAGLIGAVTTAFASVLIKRIATPGDKVNAEVELRDDLRQMKEDLKVDLAAQKAEIAELKTQAKKGDEERASLTEECRRLRNDLDVEKDCNKSLTAQLDVANKLRIGLEQNVADLRRQLNTPERRATPVHDTEILTIAGELSDEDHN